MLKKILKMGELSLMNSYKEIQKEKHPLKDLFWETTLRCNARCKHCGSNAGIQQLYEDELTTEEIKRAFKQIANDMDISNTFIDVTGGEPLVREDLCEVMEYATKELGFHWGMTSNGMLLNEKNIEKLKNANMQSISISIDGLKKTHDEFRGVQGSYDLILENIKKLQKANFLNLLQVTTVFHKKNISEIEELYKVMIDLNIFSWRLMTIDPIGRTNENKELLLDGQEIKKVLEFIKNKNNEKKIRLEYGCPGFLGLDYEKEVRRQYFYCRTGISIASILYNGDLFVCPNVPRRKEFIQGNIKKDNFKEVWENKYNIFRNENRIKCDECKKCENWKYCNGGAFHTWNFDDNYQNKCTYKMINEKSFLEG